MKRVIIFAVMLLCAMPLSAQDNIKKETFLFATNDGVELFLDRYTSTTTYTTPQPTMIFAFGGLIIHHYDTNVIAKNIFSVLFALGLVFEAIIDLSKYKPFN